MNSLTYKAYSQSAPQELDVLVNDLRHPKPGSSVNQVVGYMYHYLPFVKNEHNLRIVFASFLNSPVCYGNSAETGLALYPIIEAFKAITDKKIKISQPTLPVKTYYDVLLTEMVNFVGFDESANSWKVLPILTGIFLSNELRNRLYSRPNPVEYGWWFGRWDGRARDLFTRALNHSLSRAHATGTVDLSITCLAATFDKDSEKIHSYTGKHLDAFMVARLVGLVLGPEGAWSCMEDPSPDFAQLLQKPVMRHINRLAFLLEAYLTRLSFNEANLVLVAQTMDHILDFNRKMSSFVERSPYNGAENSAEYWMFMKSLLFSQVVIFQGIMTRFLLSNRQFVIRTPWNKPLEREYSHVAEKLLHNLYYLHFILLSIGQGGFDNYNFIYYLAVEIALKSASFPNFTMRLIGDYREINLWPGAINTNYVMRSKVLFTLGLWENYLQSKSASSHFVEAEILPVCLALADESHYDNYDLIEASHSVLLFCFSNIDVVDEKSYGRYVDYIRLLHRQFPNRLSAHQLSIATETLGKKILSKSFGSQFLELLLFKARSTPPGLPIKNTDILFDSAQPVSEIMAHSTMKSVDKETRESGDVFHANKGKKPKNLVKLDPLPHVKEYVFHDRLAPETTREALVLSVVNLVPYMPLSAMVSWLERIKKVIDESARSESQFLTRMLWRVLSENLDLNRVELAMGWWYEGIRIPSRM